LTGIPQKSPARDINAKWKQSITTLRFYWLSSSEIMFVTSLGIEMYGVMGEKRATKTLKHLSQAVSWSRYCPIAGVMAISQTPTGVAINETFS